MTKLYIYKADKSGISTCTVPVKENPKSYVISFEDTNRVKKKGFPLMYRDRIPKNYLPLNQERQCLLISENEYSFSEIQPVLQKMAHSLVRECWSASEHIKKFPDDRCAVYTASLMNERQAVETAIQSATSVCRVKL